MNFLRILALLASASLATSLPTSASSHSPCERRTLTTTAAVAVPVKGTPTTVVPKPTSIPAPAPPTPDAGNVGTASTGSGDCGSVSLQWYSGPASNFPRKSEWMSFETLFNCNKAYMRAMGNTGQDIANIHDAITQVASSHSVDDRVLLAMIMQESHGSVNTANAWDGQNTPGLMQAIGCPNHAEKATVSREDILAMVQCGANHFAQDGGASSDEDAIYVALRSYNSGPNSINRDDLSNSGSGTKAYVSEVSNRLRGWVN